MNYLREILLIEDKIICHICGNARPVHPSPPQTLILSLDGSFASSRPCYRIADGKTLEDIEREALRAGWSKEVIHGAVLYFCPECTKK